MNRSLIGGKTMKKTRAYKISVVLFCVSLVLFGISIVTGLIPGLVFAIDKISMYLGGALLSLGFVLLKKAKDNSDSEDK